MPPVRLTDAQKEEIKRLYVAGLSYRAIAGKVKCSHTAAMRLVERDPMIRRAKADAEKRAASRDRARASRERRARRDQLKARGVDPDTVLEPGDLDPSIQRLRDHRAGRPLRRPNFHGDVEAERMWLAAQARIAANGSVKPTPATRPRRRRRGIDSDGTIFMSPLQMERYFARGGSVATAVPVSAADEVRYAEERARLVTFVRADGGRTMRVDPRSEDYAEYDADEGWRRV